MDNQPVGDPASGDYDPQDQDSGTFAAANDEGVLLTRPEDKAGDSLAIANNPLGTRDHQDVGEGNPSGEQVFFDHPEESDDAGRDPQQTIGASPTDIQAHALERLRTGGPGLPTTGG